jgi:hypothetical protein
LVTGTKVTRPALGTRSPASISAMTRCDAFGAAGLVAVDRAEDDQPGAGRDRGIGDGLEGLHRGRS